MSPIVLEYIDPIDLILRSNRAESTKQQYTRAIQGYLDAGHKLDDASALAQYARALSASRQVCLQAAVAIWAEEMSNRARNQATLDNVGQIQAALYRFESLKRAFMPVRSKGYKVLTWLSQVQVKQLIDTCDDSLIGQRDRMVLAILAGAGLRREELAGLHWEQIKSQPAGDKVRTVLEIKGKGSKNRVVPVSDELVTILDNWSETNGKSGYIARSIKGKKLGDHLSAVGIFKIVRKHGITIGQPRLAPHDLRRTYAQLGYAAGVPITQISRLLGHSSIVTTQRYLNLDLDLSVTASDFIPLGGH